MTDTPNMTVPEASEEIVDSLKRLISLHDELLDVVQVEREAMTQADIKAVRACVECKALLAERLREIELGRINAVGVLFASDEGAPMPSAQAAKVSLETIAQRFDTPTRALALELGKKLSEKVARLENQHGVVRLAAESLLSHMQGLMHQVSRKLSHSGTYGRCGAIASHPQVVSGLDMTL